MKKQQEKKVYYINISKHHESRVSKRYKKTKKLYTVLYSHHSTIFSIHSWRNIVQKYKTKKSIIKIEKSLAHMKQQKNCWIKIRKKNHSYLNSWKGIKMTKLRIVFKSPSINSIQILLFHTTINPCHCVLHLCSSSNAKALTP